MPKYLLFESRDPFESKDTAYFYDLAAQLVKDGQSVTLFLVQNGVLPARKTSAGCAALKTLTGAGVVVLADEFALRERGIREDQLTPGIKAAPLEIAVDQIALGAKALWH
jgi:sulfur relay (sulfurtransferase) complex TusBCD TusD component (DsrE family)